MNKNYIIMALCAVIFIGGLLFLKLEMDQNRRILAQDVDKAIADAPAKVVQNTVNVLSQVLSNTVSSDTNRQPQSTNLLGSLFDLATDVERRVDKMALNATELSDSEEMDFGKKLDREILNDMPEEADPVNSARIETIGKNLITQCERKQINYHFRIVKSKIVNAFSIAGGYVYVTTAFLKKFPADADLAMALGHEIAHVDLKHSVHKVQYYYHAQKEIGDAASVLQIGYTLVSSPFSKEQEFEADAWGFNACKKAGWEPDKLLLFFENLDKYQQENQPSSDRTPSQFERRVGEYFDSHPKTSERLARLKKM
ncbi:MAG: M48 family metalloprotease [Verrucomicrobiota bacterium]